MTEKELNQIADMDMTPVKNYYLANPTVTLKTIAEKFNVSYRALRQHCARSKWAAERDILTEQIREDFRSATSAKAIIEKDQIDGEVESVNAALLQQIQMNLKEAQLELAPLKPSELRTIQATVNGILETKYRMLGIPAPKQEIEHLNIESPDKDSGINEMLVEGLLKDVNRGVVNLATFKADPEVGNNGNGNGRVN